MLICADERRRAALAPPAGVHPTAYIDPDATLGDGVRVGPNSSVAAGARIGDRTVIRANCVIDPGVQVGQDCEIHNAVVLLHGTHIADRCLIHSGVVVGADGFGFRPAPDGNGLVKVPHIGGVRIDSDVEVGANSCIDRGKFGDTTIGQGTKIDNLCQIGHNCSIGRSTILCGATAVGGSTVIGNGVMVGGASAMPDNARIGDGATLSGGCFILGDLAPGGTYTGMPARPANEARREYINIKFIERLKQRVRELRDRVDALEAERSGGSA